MSTPICNWVDLFAIFCCFPCALDLGQFAASPPLEHTETFSLPWTKYIHGSRTVCSSEYEPHLCFIIADIDWKQYRWRPCITRRTKTAACDLVAQIGFQLGKDVGNGLTVNTHISSARVKDQTGSRRTAGTDIMPSSTAIGPGTSQFKSAAAPKDTTSFLKAASRVPKQLLSWVKLIRLAEAVGNLWKSS